MASIIPGYEYDIFISYRQKDNKGDKWVSKFVETLKTELEATFKEDISVYFDENPHDRLQETHNVDKSLEGKLKCLIFIPILSQTYCDPNSYAWQYEFLAFNKLANADRFGIDIRLRSSNYTSRILPIRIHDLEQEDIKLFEKETGTVLRAMDFVFKTATGVSRPLKTNEDHPQDNLNKTFYSDQINKVGHAIKEIIQGMKSEPDAQDTRRIKVNEIFGEARVEDKSKELSSAAIINQKSKKWLIALLSLVLCIMGAFELFKIINNSKKAKDIENIEKSIAVLPFVNDSPDQENAYFINGIMDEILNNLQKIKDFRVLSRTSTEQFRGSNKPAIPEIAKKLDVNYIVEGSGQKYGNTFRLRVQLIAANNEKHLWAESYEQEIRDTKDIFRIQNQIAQTIASSLNATITPEEKHLIEKASTTNLTAYDFYQRGKEEYQNYMSDVRKTEALEKAEQLYKKANEYDSTFATAYIGLAGVYWEKRFYKDYFSKNFLDSVLILSDIALSFDNQSAEAHLLKGLYYIQRDKPDLALLEFDKTIKYNPNYWEAYFCLAHQIYFASRSNQDFVKGLEYLHKTVSLNHGKQLPEMLRGLGTSYASIAGFHEKAKYYIEEAFKLDLDSNKYYGAFIVLERAFGNYEKSIELQNRYFAFDSTNVGMLAWFAFDYHMLHWDKESLKYVKKFENRLKEQPWIYYSSMKYVGYAYWQNGYKKEASKWFDEQKRVSEEALQLGRLYSIDANYDLAAVYAFLGDKKNAYKNLREVAKSYVCSLWLLSAIKNEPLFNPIRNDKEFQQILNEMESKYQAEHERVRKWLEEQGKL
jgi:TolB-like protein